MPVSPDDFLAKMDWEGYDGITWFKESDFEDFTLGQLVQAARDSWEDFQDDLRLAEQRANELVNEVSSIDTRSEN